MYLIRMINRKIWTQMCSSNAYSTLQSFSSVKKVNIANKQIKFDRLGFIGMGKIAQAIIIGLIKQKKITSQQIYVSDTTLDGLEHLRQRNPLFHVKIIFIISIIKLFKITILNFK